MENRGGRVSSPPTTVGGWLGWLAVIESGFAIAVLRCVACPASAGMIKPVESVAMAETGLPTYLAASAA